MTGCTACATELPDGARFCLNCGQPVAAACAGCGAPLVPQAKFCMECGTPRAAGSAPTPAPEPTGASSRRTTSILFADLVGFTTLSETRDTEDVRELLGRYFDECRQIVARYGGTIEKFIGDAVMAVWGVPTAHEDDAERAVRAGLELVTAVHDFGHDVGAPELALRVGIVTGEVAVTTGAEGQGMVAGDPVNTAARVQSVAVPGQVWVDETTRLLTTAAITYADAGSHALKGKSDPVPLWSVRAIVAAVGGAQRADGLEATLVGRDRELRLVKELFHQCAESRRPVLLVVDGEPGVGKSRLAWEFEKYIDGLNDIVRWHSGRCVAYGEGVAYFALAEAVRGRLQASQAPTDEDDPGAEQLLETALARYVPDESERAWLRDRLAALLGTGTHDAGQASSFAREDLFSAWVTFLERAGEGHPVTLVIDDAQHADDGLVAFLEHLVTVADFPCFVVLLARPDLIERRPSLAAHRRVNVIHVPTLVDADMTRLVEGLVADLPSELVGQVVRRSEGLPLFAVETVRSLIDRDLVVPRGGQYVLAAADVDLDSLAVPATLHALVAARLDALTPDQRLVVDRASVLGTTFPPGALAGVCPEVADLSDVLRQLVRMQILSQDTSRISSEYGQYRFVQSALRQVAYGVLSRRDRRAMHLAVVAHFEASGETGDDTAAIRAQHYVDALQAAEDPAEDPRLRAAAVRNLVAAAERASGLGSPRQAAGHLAVAVPLADDRAVRAGLVLRLSRAECDAGVWDEAAGHGRQALDELVELGDRPSAGVAAAVVADALLSSTRKTDAALAIAEPWWEELHDRDDAVEARFALSRAVATGRYWTGRDTTDVVQSALILAEEHGNLRVMGECYAGLAIEWGNKGATRLSHLLFEGAAELARECRDPKAEALALCNLNASWNARDVPTALRHGTQSVSAAVRSGDVALMSYAVSNYAIALWQFGDWTAMDEALAMVGERALGVALDECIVACIAWRNLARGEASGIPEDLRAFEGDDQLSRAWSRAVAAVRRQESGDLAEAVVLAVDAAADAVESSGYWDDLTPLWGYAAELAVLGDADPAVVSRLTAMVDEARIEVAPGLLAHRALLRGRLGGGEGGAEADLTEAVERFRAWGSPVWEARARAALGQWLLGQGRVEEAEAHLTEARTTYEQLGATAWLAELVPVEPPGQRGLSRP